MHNRPPEGNPKGDVYSFGIICQEIVYRNGVFYLSNMDLSPEGRQFIILWQRTSFAFIYSEIPVYGLLPRSCTRLVPLVEQKLRTLPEHLSSPPVFNGVRVTQSLVLCVCFVNRCLFFSFGHCVVCFSSIYGLSLPVCYFKLFFRKLLKQEFTVVNLQSSL